jgi:hypothetical protein
LIPDPNIRSRYIAHEERLEEFHHSLSAHFESMASVRKSEPIFVFEHRLSTDDLGNLLSVVRKSLRIYDINSGWWNKRYLPLLIAATEVGYDYAGAGTDFWPKFADRFGLATHVDRQALSALFARAAARYAMAVPADTPWTRAFCHIAWPILHSIMPRELHRPFAFCLNDVRVRLDLTSDDLSLITPIRTRAQFYAGSRLLAWLETPAPAAAITRFFLGSIQEAGLDEIALGRIASDLAKDQAVITALQSARRRQKALQSAPVRNPRARRSEPETRIASLVLCQIDKQWSLALKLPQMEQALRTTTRDALDAIRWRTQLWSQGRPIAARNLFSDHQITLTLTKLPASSAPILTDLHALPISQEAQFFLGGLRIQSAPPLLFADADGSGDYNQLLSSTATSNRRYLLLVADDAPPAPSNAAVIGRIAGLRAFVVDTIHDQVRAWLVSIGITVRDSATFIWIGAPELEQHRPVQRFRAGALLAFEATCSSGLLNAVTLTDPDEQRTVLTGTGRLVGTDVPLLAVRVEAGLGSIADLVSKNVALRFESAMSLQEAMLDLRLVSHGREIAHAASILPDTPCRVTAEHPVWSDLLNTATIMRLLETDRVELCVRVAKSGGNRPPH